MENEQNTDTKTHKNKIKNPAVGLPASKLANRSRRNFTISACVLMLGLGLILYMSLWSICFSDIDSSFLLLGRITLHFPGL